MTYAVYHKDGNAREHHITRNEKEAAHTIQEAYGSIKMKGPLRSAFPSSNRAEAAGILLALARHIPLHIGVDNALAVRNSNRIINGLQGTYNKQWKLHANGDIWRKIDKAIQQRGEGTTRVTKLKGHANGQHVHDKLISADYREGNIIADSLASEAYEGFKNHVPELSNLYGHRTNHCTELVQVIQLTMLRVIEALQDKRRAMALIAPSATATYVRGIKKTPMLLKHISYPVRDGTKLKFLKVARTDVTHIVKTMPNPESIRQLQDFLINLAMAPHQARRSWHIMGGTCRFARGSSGHCYSH